MQRSTIHVIARSLVKQGDEAIQTHYFLDLPLRNDTQSLRRQSVETTFLLAMT